MQDWQIGVLVVIIVVFVALATLLVLLIYRFGNWRRCCRSGASRKTVSRYVDTVREAHTTVFDGSGDAYSHLFRGDPRIRPSTHVMYFLDFQGELHWIDFKKRPATTIHGEVDIQQYLVDTFQPTIEEGNRVVAFSPEMLGLSYVSDPFTIVVMDLNRLLARDAEFGARMLHTAERPLLLSRLVADGADGAVFTALSRYGYTVGGAAVPPATQITGGPGATPTPAAGAAAPYSHTQQIELDLSRSRANPMVQVPTSLSHTPPPQPPLLPAAVPLPSAGAAVYAADGAGMAPTPVIHPAETHHIATSTLISITAATYTVLHSAGGRTELDAVNTARIEAARMRWDHRSSLLVPLVTGPLTGYLCAIDPVSEGATLFAPASTAASARTAEPMVCLRADALYYTVERVNSTQWLPFTAPFFLPAGRWCVRARAVLYRDDSSQTSAKVFTVNVM